MSKELQTFTVTIINVTDKALIVDHEGTTICLPESQIEYSETDLAKAEANCNVEIEIEVPEWLAYEKGMI